jgi:hypothetical protein
VVACAECKCSCSGALALLLPVQAHFAIDGSKPLWQTLVAANSFQELFALQNLLKDLPQCLVDADMQEALTLTVVVIFCINTLGIV